LSARFCGLMPISGTFPRGKPRKTFLMISARLHGYARKCLACSFITKLQQKPHNSHSPARRSRT
ncbi:hypothetical protein, partial [Escherichia coli]|uniref:hypothetical protein n=1 Tax=Escherichia coli TaxID=562 RepID=UPI001BE8AE16